MEWQYGLLITFSGHFSRRVFFFLNAVLYLLLPGSLVLCIIERRRTSGCGCLSYSLTWSERERRGLCGMRSIYDRAADDESDFCADTSSVVHFGEAKIRLLIPMVIIGIISLAVLYPLVGWEFTQPLDEAKTLRALNIQSILNPLFFNHIGVGEKFWNWIDLAISVGLVCLAALRHRVMLISGLCCPAFGLCSMPP
ncbi:hypothetical protein PEC18_19830 [Paucibacter sp. O1-1]|nr:hypothetical protein [Paucibacter sp. O1-1]MDA3828017.1 hypothetical protein [Paucibacter sp. O1-1]